MIWLTHPERRSTLFFAHRRGLTTEDIVNQPASPPASGGVAFLAHRRGDDGAVAVRDVAPGAASAAYLESGDRFDITVATAIPLGHKIALRDLAASENVLEYGVLIGLTRVPVTAGELVHTHNLRSARWQKSV
jgi:(2R)-sulfolactate sulfo-lyase subunit alpha